MFIRIIDHEIDFSQREIDFNKNQLKRSNKFQLINIGLVILMITSGILLDSFNWLNGLLIGINFYGFLSNFSEVKINKIEIKFHKKRIKYFEGIKEIYEKKS